VIRFQSISTEDDTKILPLNVKENLRTYKSQMEIIVRLLKN